MTYKILGLPYEREEFKINDSYRGLYRNDMPRSRIQEKSIIEHLEDLFLTYALADNNEVPVDELLKVTDSFRKFSTEPFELILVKGIKEDIPENILYKSLGYEVLDNDETSMIHFCLRKKVEGFENFYDTNVKKLNSNYLFSSIEEAQSFIEEIKQYPNIVSQSANVQINFEVVEIILVEGISGDNV